MSLDRQKSGTPAKPFTPTLSTALRNTKSPLTPKLAGSKNASPTSPPRRALRSESTAPPTSRKEDFRSPATPTLNGNITPRSGARMSRIGGESPSTPGDSTTGTPSRTRPLSAIELSKPRRYLGATTGLGIDALGVKQNTGAVAPTLATGRLVSSESGRRVSTGSARNGAGMSASPRFVHANDILPSSASKVGQMVKTEENTTFPYASDAAGRTNSPEPLQPTPQSLEKKDQGKFFYADGRPSDHLSPSRNPPIAAKAGPAATSSPPSRTLNIQIATRDLDLPPSPTKAESLRSAPATFNSGSGKPVKARIADGSVKPTAPVTPSDSSRRTSIASKTSTVRQVGQRRPSIPVDSTPSTPPQKAKLQISPRAYIGQVASQQPEFPQSPTERISPRSTSLSSSNTGVSTQTLDSTPANSAHPLSPAKSVPPQSPLQRSNELAANARRERKVLDLEISNSSLLAINRTLEREMRKQSLELRKFRRRSRCRQVSTASTAMRSVSGQSGLGTVAESEDGDGDAEGEYGSLSDLGEMSNSEFDGSDPESAYDDDSSLLSPTSPSERSLRARTRDEKRLRLDLSRHQQLLIDSQKMNQSIKRCLNWTDELINEGRKALEYQVKVSDVQVGGKVLVPDEEEDEGGGGGVDGGSSEKGLLSAGNLLPVSTPNEVKQERKLWRQGLEEMEMEVDRMLAQSSTLKEVVPA
ncbi:hypothetical protein EPUS_00610 [Endocarpon pusillum Z07020]|uniref:Uncharacterized protein n=1 Tax=Endocarpon pusillum (strain Z07020 / HMAS-L-300199) TaxID=1263415 RepID=U1GIK6_ENDPU|nr:uncharacterized protein EPUS_00610 [Endocarpon pusillum Z07020]ERF71621.1 hypothetical protein EPUS_00610 [Endocarpon pusillum Z07020]